jgi:hypothetical protein
MAATATRATLVVRTNGADADVEIVWSWPPDAEVKLREMIARRQGQDSPVPGESTYKA